MHGSARLEPCGPELGVRYPFKIGKSLRRPSAARELLALKFMDIPDKASLHSPATLSRHDDKCSVNMRTTDGNSSVNFEGIRRQYGSDSSVSDFVLVFVNGQMWLERAADYFQSIRPVHAARNDRPPVEYPEQNGEDDPVRDPDSWLATSDGESGSPITPEEDAVMEETPAIPARTAGKSTAPTAAVQGRRLVSAGRVSGGKVVASSAAAKSVATKSVAGKGLTNVSGHSGRRRAEEREDDDDDDDDVGSSSDEDDSDDSDSDSDSDGSGEFTDQSSDEDE